jgi:hypothetical protein
MAVGVIVVGATVVIVVLAVVALVERTEKRGGRELAVGGRC